jgi:hypothetical protein
VRPGAAIEPCRVLRTYIARRHRPVTIRSNFSRLRTPEDLEAVSTEPPEAVAPWKAARALRQALALAAGEDDIAPIEALLLAADPRQGSSIDVVPAARRRQPNPPRTWPTTGGNAARDALAEGLGADLQLRWFKGPSDDDDLTDSRDPTPDADDRPSVWLPPRAVATDAHLLVSDGEYLHIYDLEDGRRVVSRREGAFPRTRPGGHGTDSGEDRRERYGLLEGHALSVHRVFDFQGMGPLGPVKRPGPGWLVLAAVPDGNPWYIGRAVGDIERRRNDHIQAYHWDGQERLTRLWRVGGLLRQSEIRQIEAAGLERLPPDTRLYGAPLLYQGRVWVAGIRPAQATEDRWEAWIASCALRVSTAAKP